MKEIKAIIQPFTLAKVVRALQQIPELPGLTVSEIQGFGRSPAGGATNMIDQDSVGYVKKTKLEIVVADDMVERVLMTITDNAHTGNPGDGKVFVYEVDEVVRIRTGERGLAAI